jgi:amidase
VELAFASAREIARRIRNHELGCVEALDYFIGRVERYDPLINAVVVHDFDRARERARSLDRRRTESDPPGPLHGVPMTVKECFQLTGTPTTFGVTAYRDNIARANAVAVDRLLYAGANIFGKTNVPPWLADGQSANPIYGRTNNPWSLDRTPGGSSGGSAAALAAGLTGLELGSDIASSIRNPAHYCGVFGHKTTWGIASPYRKSLAESAPPDDISVIGPLARSAGDLELALSIVAGPDEAVPSNVRIGLPVESRTRLAEFRVAFAYDDAFAPVDDEVSAPLRALADALREAGADVREARPDLDSEYCYRVYMTLMRAASAGRASDGEFAQLQEQAATVSTSASDMRSTALRGATLTHRDWLRLNGERRGIQDRWRAFFEDVDVFLCPPLATAAHLHMPEEPARRALTINGKQVPYGRQLFWAGHSGVAYLPATVAPLGRTPGGLPTGVQIVGPQYHDLRCIRFAQLLEQHYRAFEPPPGFD